MKLYYAPGACSLASHIVAAEAGLKIELEKVNLKTHRTESGADFYAVNPKGYVPALILDDGSLLTENVALLTFLGDKGGFAAKDDKGRYRLLEWLAFITSELHKSFAPLFHGGSEEARHKARETILKHLAFVNEKLTADYLMGPDFSAADAYLYVMLLWCAKLHIDISGLENIMAFKARMNQRKGVKMALAEEGLA